MRSAHPSGEGHTQVSLGFPTQADPQPVTINRVVRPTWKHRLDSIERCVTLAPTLAGQIATDAPTPKVETESPAANESPADHNAFEVTVHDFLRRVERLEREFSTLRQELSELESATA